MKKVLLLIVLIFGQMIGAEAASDTSVETLTCKYENNNEQIIITYYNVGTVIGDANILYRVEHIQDNINYCYEGINNLGDYKCSNDNYVSLINISNLNSSLNFRGEQYYGIYNRFTRIDAQAKKLDASELCSQGIFFTDEMSSTGEVEVVLCENSQNSSVCNATDSDLFVLESYTSGKNPYAGSNETVYEDFYNETQDDIQKYCQGEEYDEKKCEQAKNNLNTTVDAAEESGVSKEELDIKYEEYRSNLEWDANTCNAILGSVTDKNAPAYYLDFAFNILKYFAIIILFVFTLIDFIKATISSDDQALKKALQQSIKRVIICLIIFFLPILIEFILELLGIIDDPTCGIGVD